MSDKYYILRVEHLQKVCYVVLGDIPGFKALKIVDEIHSYFEKNSIDIFTALFFVSFDVYQRWLQILVSENLIEINAGKNAALDEVQLSSLKSHATSIKYELEIEPHASIRSYTCDIPEIAKNLFNEWFNGIKSDKRKEKEMSDNTVSPILSVVKERIKQLKQLELDMDTIKSDIQKHRDAIGELSFKHNELNEDICHINDRIHHLCDQAVIEDGVTREYIRRFLEERGYQQY